MKNKNFKFLGENVKLHEYSKFVHQEVIEIGEGSQIDDFVLINGGSETVIGRYNHIASFVGVIGGGRFITGDYVGIAVGTKIITGTHHYGDGRRISPLVPVDEQCVIRGEVRLGDDVFIGANVTIFPNVTIGEGAIIGAASLVKDNVEPWSIYVGTPAKKVGVRPKIEKP